MASKDGLRATPDLVKLYYRIGEVSQIVGVQPHVLRYWESEFHSIRPQKSRKGQRVYSRLDVEKLLRVKDLLRNQGFTIAGAKRRLHPPSAHQGGMGVTVSVTSPLAPLGPLAMPVSVATTVSSRPPDAHPSRAGSPAEGRYMVGLLAPSAEAAPSEVRPKPRAFDGDSVEPSLATQPLARLAAASEYHRAETGHAAKSLRRRLVEIRRDVARMLAELSV